jgi:hypothetical protein
MPGLGGEAIDGMRCADHKNKHHKHLSNKLITYRVLIEMSTYK